MLTPATDEREITDSPGCRCFIPVPLCYQETEFTCGVACLQSLLARYGIHYRQSALADVLHSQPILGTDYETILYFVKLLGFTACMAENLEISDIRKNIQAGIAPMLIIQAWKDDEINYSLDWKDAHYVIACGYYSNGIYAMDPNMMGNYAYLPYSELLDRWHVVDKSGVRHINSALLIQYENCPVYYDPNAVRHMG